MLNYLLLNPSAECRERENVSCLISAFTRMDKFLSARSRVAHPLLIVQHFDTLSALPTPHTQHKTGTLHTLAYSFKES